MGKNQKVLRSLDDLRQIEFISLPELPEIDLSPENLENQAEVIRKGKRRISGWIKNILPKLEEIAVASPEAQELAAKEVNKITSTLEDYLNHKTLAYRRTAWEALLTHEFSKEFSTREEVINHLQSLVEKGYLTEDSKGPLRTYGKRYDIPVQSQLTDQKKEEIRKLFISFTSRAWARDGIKRARDIRQEANLTSHDLMAGKTGKYVGFLSPKKVEEKNSIFWLSGGAILVESDGRKVKPIKATGDIAFAIEKVKKLGVYLSINSLKQERPPFIQGLEPEKDKKIKFFWHLLKRSFQEEKIFKKIEEEKKFLNQKTTLSAEEWFLEQKPGICLAEFQGIWEKKNPENGEIIDQIPHLFFLIERRKEKGETKICPLEIPKHLEKLLGSLGGKEFSEKGTKFEGCPQPLQAILRAIFGQVAKLAQVQ